MIRYTVCTAAMLLIVAFVALLYYSLLTFAPGSTEMKAGLWGSIVAGYTGIGLLFWFYKLDREHRSQQLRLY